MGQNETGAPEEAALPEMPAGLVAPQGEQVDTPEVFFATLMASDDVDVVLAGILSDHLFVVTPHANAIVTAPARLHCLQI